MASRSPMPTLDLPPAAGSVHRHLHDHVVVVEVAVLVGAQVLEAEDVLAVCPDVVVAVGVAVADHEDVAALGGEDGAPATGRARATLAMVGMCRRLVRSLGRSTPR